MWYRHDYQNDIDGITLIKQEIKWAKDCFGCVWKYADSFLLPYGQSIVNGIFSVKCQWNIVVLQSSSAFMTRNSSHTLLVLDIQWSKVIDFAIFNLYCIS